MNTPSPADSQKPGQVIEQISHVYANLLLARMNLDRSATHSYIGRRNPELLQNDGAIVMRALLGRLLKDQKFIPRTPDEGNQYFEHSMIDMDRDVQPYNAALGSASDIAPHDAVQYNAQYARALLLIRRHYHLDTDSVSLAVRRFTFALVKTLNELRISVPREWATLLTAEDRADHAEWEKAGREAHGVSLEGIAEFLGALLRRRADLHPRLQARRVGVANQHGIQRAVDVKDDIRPAFERWMRSKPDPRQIAEILFGNMPGQSGG